MNDTLIIMPAFNEEKNIPGVIKSIKNLDLPLDILVVNDGSRDNTGKIASAEGVDVISHPCNLGYGAALQTGFKYAEMRGYKYVVQFDSDGQHCAADIPSILDVLKNRKFDIVIGSRFLGNPNYSIRLSKRIAIKFFRILIRILAGSDITDPTSGLKGLNARAFRYHSSDQNYPQDFPDADVLIKMLYLKYCIGEVPAHMMDRQSGKSMHSGLKSVLYIFKMMISIFMIILRGNLSKEVS